MSKIAGKRRSRPRVLRVRVPRNVLPIHAAAALSAADSAILEEARKHRTRHGLRAIIPAQRSADTLRLRTARLRTAPTRALKRKATPKRRAQRNFDDFESILELRMHLRTFDAMWPVSKTHAAPMPKRKLRRNGSRNGDSVSSFIACVAIESVSRRAAQKNGTREIWHRGRTLHGRPRRLDLAVCSPPSFSCGQKSKRTVCGAEPETHLRSPGFARHGDSAHADPRRTPNGAALASGCSQLPKCWQRPSHRSLRGPQGGHGCPPCHRIRHLRPATMSEVQFQMVHN